MPVGVSRTSNSGPDFSVSYMLPVIVKAGIASVPPRATLRTKAPGFVASTDEEAKELFYPGYKEIRDRIGGQRGWPPPPHSSEKSTFVPSLLNVAECQ